MCFNISQISMGLDRKLSALYYSPRGYWKGLTAIKKLASAAKGTEQRAKWLKRQAICQIYLPAQPPPPGAYRGRSLTSPRRTKYTRRICSFCHTTAYDGKPSATLSRSLMWPRATKRLSLWPLTSKTGGEVADGLARIYKRSPLRWPKLLQVDPGREFMGVVSQLLAKHGVEVRRGHVDIHRDQGVVERWNRTPAERLFGHQYAQEMRLKSGQKSIEWVARLPSVVAALNGEVTRLTGKKPSDAIKLRRGTQKPSSIVPGRPVGLEEQKVPSGVGVRFLYEPGEREGGRRRATDTVWSLTVHRLGRSVTKPDEPVLYYLQDGPSRGFVREELLVVPPDTQLPPDGVLKR